MTGLGRGLDALIPTVTAPLPDTPAPPPDRPAPLCANWPTDRQTKKARRRFGEGFTWTCPSCGLVLVLRQGKGSRWYWAKAVAR